MTEQNDFANIIRCTLNLWHYILIIALIVALSSGIISSRLYNPQYETSAIIVIHGKDVSGNNIKDAQQTAGVFQEIITSSLLQKKVAEVLELESLPGSVYCDAVPNTNMMKLRVRTDSPENSMIVMNGILEHYDEAVEALLGDIVLQILEEPKVPVQAVNTYDGVRILIRTLGMSIIVICAMLLIYFYFRDDIKNENQVEKKLDTKLFATIYHESLEKGIRNPFRKKKKKGKILISNPITSFGYIETFQKLCTKLEYKMERQNKKIILVTSVQENEGKSTVSANMALALAKRGKKVLLVDADLRKPAQFKLFEQFYLKNNPQIGDVLTGKCNLEDTIRDVDGVGVQLLAGNRSYKNATRILMNPKIEKIFRETEQDVDYIIVDTPPMCLTADAEVMMRYADMGLLVVRQNCAKVKDINDAIDVFKKADCKLMGCIMNDTKFGFLGTMGKKNDSYYNKYGYGYDYYRKEKGKQYRTL